MFYQVFIRNATTFWEAIHTLFQFGIGLAVVYIVMGVVFLNEFFIDNSDDGGDPFLVIHARVEV